jgi:hypothetical protein
MTRTARKPQVSAQFFRVDGADQETGEETYLVLQAPTKPVAEKLARQQGLLISAVRVARADDWGGPAPSKPKPKVSPTVRPDPEPQITPDLQLMPEVPTAPVSDPSPFIDANHSPEPSVEPTNPVSSSAPPAIARGSSAAAVVLGCVGAALLLGGVLALALALWPDTAVRNELQQIDYRLHELSQTLLGGMLVLGGLTIFSLSIICHHLNR